MLEIITVLSEIMDINRLNKDHGGLKKGISLNPMSIYYRNDAILESFD